MEHVVMGWPRVHPTLGSLKGKPLKENGSRMKATSWQSVFYSHSSSLPLRWVSFFLDVITDIPNDTRPGVTKNLPEATLLLHRTNAWQCIKLLLCADVFIKLLLCLYKWQPLSFIPLTLRCAVSAPSSHCAALGSTDVGLALWLRAVINNIRAPFLLKLITGFLTIFGALLSLYGLHFWASYNYSAEN